MKLRHNLLAITFLGGIALSGQALAGEITYNVNLTIGSGGVTGTITTDGTIGVLSASDFVSWNLIGTGNGGVTFTDDTLNSIVEVGNSSQVFNPNAGTPNLTADANNIYFNFDGTDGGNLGFEPSPGYQIQNYIGFGANFNQQDTLTGKAVVPVFYNDPSTVNEAAYGIQVIASAGSIGGNLVPLGNSVPDASSTMPLLGLGFGALAAAGRRFRK